MTTITQGRTLITLKVPKSFSTLLTNEAKALDSSLASLARGAIKWHRGDGLARHPDRPPLKLAKRVSGGSVQKGMLIEEEDAKYLDEIGSRIGLARTATLILILLQYLGIELLPPREK